MTSYSVQYTLPVDNPVSNVSKSSGKGSIEFLVPINHPDAHTMGFMDLLAAAELSGLIHLRTRLKNKRLTVDKNTSKPGL
jgi:hypothetical protein